MTDMDDYYMKVGKYASKPEPEKEDSLLAIYSYLAGAVIAVVFCVWFLMWVVARP